MSRKHKMAREIGVSAPVPEPRETDQQDMLHAHILLLSKLLDQTKCPVCNGVGHLHVSSQPCPMCPVRDAALKDYRELFDKEGNPR